MAAAKPEVVITMGLQHIEMWSQMLLPCFQGSHSQCNFDCYAILSKSTWNSIYRPQNQPPYWTSRSPSWISHISLRNSAQLILHFYGDHRYTKGSSIWYHICRSKVITRGLLPAVGRHLELICYITLSWVLRNVTVVPDHQYSWKLHENMMPCTLINWHEISFSVFVFPAAILDFRCNKGL